MIGRNQIIGTKISEFGPESVNNTKHTNTFCFRWSWDVDTLQDYQYFLPFYCRCINLITHFFTHEYVPIRWTPSCIISRRWPPARRILSVLSRSSLWQNDGRAKWSTCWSITCRTPALSWRSQRKWLCMVTFNRSVLMYNYTFYFFPVKIERRFKPL